MNNFLKTKLFPYLLKKVIELISSSCRVEILEGEKLIDKLILTKQPVIFTMWHNRLFYNVFYLWKRLFFKGLNVTALISSSDDGEIMAGVTKLAGWSVARGSSSRGGREALKSMISAVRFKKDSLLMTPDGPRGPKYKLKHGALTIAQATKIQIVPVAWAAKRYWRFQSWDNFVIPKPFTKIVISFEKPISIPRKTSEKEKENLRLKVEEIMKNQLSQLQGHWND